jgi:hypothetical protein
MVEKTKIEPVTPTGPIDCACVIHGDAYSWTYVERLYNMLQRNITPGIRLHVYTEAHRPVPEPMIKHPLIDWGIGGPKRSWWYKLQLFNTANFAGPLLYFDLDTVIVGNIDWLWNLSLRNFWAVQDFKYLWRPTHQGINSSVMWWDTRLYGHIWRDFKPKDIDALIRVHPGDQDYLTQNLDSRSLRFFPQERVKSWRWQCLDGGYNFKQRMYQTPGTGTLLQKNTSVLIFHGKPKPNEVDDAVVLEHWR